MSFILDALKKSEKKRETAEVPNLHTVHGEGPPPPPRKRRPLWPYLLIAVLLLNAGVLIWYVFFREEPQVAAVVTEPAPAPIAESAPVSPAIPAPPVVPAPEPVTPSPEPVVTPPRPTPEPASAPTPATVPPPRPEPVPVPVPVREAEVAKVVVSPPPPVQSHPEAPAAAMVPEPVAPPQPIEVGPPPVLELDDLPGDVRGRVPEMTISVYAYSATPASRLVRINNRILREGSYLDVGLRLEEIAPKELIFTFEGFRFRVPKEM